MSEHPSSGDAAPEPEPDAPRSDDDPEIRRPTPSPQRTRLQNDLLRLAGHNLPLLTTSNWLSQSLREASPMRRAITQMRDLGITPPYAHVSAIQQAAQALNALMPRQPGIVPTTTMFQARTAALQLQGLFPNIRELTAYTFPIPADLEEELDSDLEELEEPARQFLRSQGPLSWTEQRRLFALYVTAFFFILLMTMVIESEAAKELGEDAALVWPAAAAAGLVAHKHWEKISPRPPGEEDDEEDEAQAD